MKRLITIAFVLCAWLGLQAQTDAQITLDEAKARLEEFNTERLLDSLDQEKLPRLVSGGLFGGGNVSNFIITRNHQPMSSYMRIGAEVGGFLDFALTKHFSIQPQVILTAHQNYFAATDTTNRLWSFGVDIPIYFLGRFGNMEQGYIQFGGGLFTHFTYMSNVKDKYSNVDEPPTASSAPLFRMPYEETPTYDYSRLYQLHNNHFGVCLLVGYECPFGMIINVSYKVSLSDIAGFYSEKKGDPAADALIYPQSVSLSIGYRWR
ncbi:MAG: outer membrane beta-barrel protein [Paludibacteraceae bacterium]|nr:outer membrane beta-barrel protein [Paludibacteraceae bacterium]MBQ2189972.1 outer membrane beta-barrel protein [Paludibacteraceae bacterium]MBQ2520077.1 outer membrane beta-barrel protein [Paludibacteraceae bacterium]MBQ4017984.1 outer membrane beta-barrel protein [Paludibacteraceae bacterium]MBQ5379049.1 outer membrane beta-barrel protein [Paludibacteraceae bacterium]